MWPAGKRHHNIVQPKDQIEHAIDADLALHFLNRIEAQHNPRVGRGAVEALDEFSIDIQRLRGQSHWVDPAFLGHLAQVDRFKVGREQRGGELPGDGAADDLGIS